MAKFMFAYHGGKMPESEEDGKRIMAEWGAWFEGMGSGLADPGGPVGKSHTVTAKGSTAEGGANPVSGYTIVNAADYPAAIKLAQGCPMVRDGSGNVEVAEILDM